MTCFIILNYNDCDNCIRLLKTVSQFKCVDFVVVTDNCSTDDSVIRLREFECEKIRIIVTEKNGGYSYGNNRGAEFAINELKADKLVFSNTDIMIDEDALYASLNAVGTDNIAYCTPLMQYSYNDKPEPISVQYSKKWFPSIMKKTLIGALICKLRRKKAHPRGVHDVNHTCNALFVITAEAFIKVGMLDENVFLYYEEDILFYKLRKNGYRVTVDGDHKYIHDHAASTKKAFNRYKRYKITAESARYYWFNVVGIKPLSRFFYKIIDKIILAERFIVFHIFK